MNEREFCKALEIGLSTGGHVYAQRTVGLSRMNGNDIVVNGKRQGLLQRRPPFATTRFDTRAAQRKSHDTERLLRLVDLIQMITFWIGFAISLALYYSIRPTDFLLRFVLGLVTVVVLGSEAWLAVVTRRSFLRLRGFILGGLYVWFLLKPLLFGATHNSYHLRVSIEDLFYALVVGLLFPACIWTGYVIRGNKQGILARGLNEIIPRISPNTAFWICIGCLMPELINRWVHTDWSRVQSLPLALLGQDAAARFSIGRIGGDERSFWRPATFLFELLSVTATVAFLKCKGRQDLRLIVIAIYIFNVISLSLGWSRYKFGMAVFTPILLMMCVYPASKHLRFYTASVLLLAMYLVMGSLMLEGRAGGWFRRGVEESFSVQRKDRIEKSIEDTFSVLANVLRVVPEQEPYFPFYDVYYLIAINPIPRLLWKNKPIVDQEYLGKRRPFYCTVTCAGDAYLCGGLWHVIAFSLAFGWIARSLDNFFQPWKPMETEFALVFLAIASFVFILVRSIVSVTTFGFPAMALLAFLSVVRFVRGRKGKTTAPQRRMQRPGTFGKARSLPTRAQFATRRG